MNMRILGAAALVWVMASCGLLIAQDGPVIPLYYESPVGGQGYNLASWGCLSPDGSWYYVVEVNLPGPYGFQRLSRINTTTGEVEEVLAPWQSQGTGQVLSNFLISHSGEYVLFSWDWLPGIYRAEFFSDTWTQIIGGVGGVLYLTPDEHWLYCGNTYKADLSADPVTWEYLFPIGGSQALASPAFSYIGEVSSITGGERLRIRETFPPFPYYTLIPVFSGIQIRVWSPDESKLYFEGGDGFHWHQVTVPGGEVTQLTGDLYESSEFYRIAPMFPTPDGLGFCGTAIWWDEPIADVVVMDSMGGPYHRLYVNDEDMPDPWVDAISEDGSFVMIASVHSGATYLHELFRVNLPSFPLPPLMMRGDGDGDGTVNLADAITLLGFLYLGGTIPAPLDRADVDDNGTVDLSDAIYLLEFLFLGGPPPPHPYPQEAFDLTTDSIP